MYCRQCGTEIPYGVRVCPNCRTSSRRPRRGLIIWILVAGIAIAVTFAVVIPRHTKYAALNAKLEEAVGRDAGYTETILKVEAEASSMTFAELFDLCHKSIDARTQLIVELRGLYPNLQSDVRSKLIDFLNAENELTRQKSAYYRKSLTFSTSMEILLDHLQDYPTGHYGWDYHKRRTFRLKEELMTAAAEMSQSATAYVSSYGSLVEQEEALAKLMKAKGLRFVPIFAKYEESNRAIEENAEKAVTNLPT